MGRVPILLCVRSITIAGTIAGTLAGSSACSPPSVQQGTCLSDQQICQFQVGTSTKDDLRGEIGDPQMSSGNVFVYICEEVSVTTVVHNDLVTYRFDGEVLAGITVLRQGSGATPAPPCATGI